MPAPTHARSEFFKPLAALAVVQKGGFAYYWELKRSSDPIVVAGAWCGLLDTKSVPEPTWDELLSMCRFGGVRAKAFAFFREIGRPDYARRAAGIELESHDDLEQQAMLARLDFDAGRTADIEGRLYLATGEFTHLCTASAEAEISGGWRPSLEWAVRAVAVAPLSLLPIQRLYIVLESAQQPELLEEVAGLFTAQNLHLQIAQIFLAAAAMVRGDGTLCLSRLKTLDDAKIAANSALSPYHGAVRALRAQAEEKLGHYQKAYEAYVALNAADRAKNIDPTHFGKGIAVRGRLNVPALPPDTHPPVVQLVGFPRSGTTLLENALNAHPLVETFEEVEAFNIAVDRIERVLLAKAPPEPAAKIFLAARDAYYDDIAGRRRKPGATFLVDKMPIRSADARFISKLFVEWRYIFSIRHPFDVVLSCFKQRFTPNPAMENFRTIADAARLYDLAMTEWFAHFSLDDSRVHYVRYEPLVTDFEDITRGVLSFIGAPWDDAVLDFSKAAERRAVKTPSYHKVRQGLSIGVQTAWRNYDFVFRSDAARPLHKWAEFFGYPTT